MSSPWSWDSANAQQWSSYSGNNPEAGQQRQPNRDLQRSRGLFTQRNQTTSQPSVSRPSYTFAPAPSSQMLGMGTASQHWHESFATMNIPPLDNNPFEDMNYYSTNTISPGANFSPFQSGSQMQSSRNAAEQLFQTPQQTDNVLPAAQSSSSPVGAFMDDQVDENLKLQDDSDSESMFVPEGSSIAADEEAHDTAVEASAAQPKKTTVTRRPAKAAKAGKGGRREPKNGHNSPYAQLIFDERLKCRTWQEIIPLVSDLARKMKEPKHIVDGWTEASVYGRFRRSAKRIAADRGIENFDYDDYTYLKPSDQRKGRLLKQSQQGKTPPKTAVKPPATAISTSPLAAVSSARAASMEPQQLLPEGPSVDADDELLNTYFEQALWSQNRAIWLAITNEVNERLVANGNRPLGASELRTRMRQIKGRGDHTSKPAEP